MFSLSFVAMGAVVASAQAGSDERRHSDSLHHHKSRRYENNSVCVDKGRKLHIYELRARADGHLSLFERKRMRALRRELDRACGGYRWHRYARANHP